MASLQGANPLIRGPVVESDTGAPASAPRVGAICFGSSRFDSRCGSLRLSAGHGKRSSSLAPIRAAKDTRTTCVNGRDDSVQGNVQLALCVLFSCSIHYLDVQLAFVLQTMSRRWSWQLNPFHCRDFVDASKVRKQMIDYFNNFYAVAVTSISSILNLDGDFYQKCFRRWNV